jgi:23S rRNA (uridine2552-2'-O)-methyltransferase
LDLGAAPGGWLQAARQIVGNTGYVLGVDKDEIEDLPFDNVETLTADLTENNILELLQSRDSAQFDVILSDLSPNVSGVWDLDHVRQLELARISLRIARAMLKPEGNMLVKVFQGSELKEFELEMRSSFRTMRIVKPPASRSESAELYFLGLGFIPSQN